MPSYELVYPEGYLEAQAEKAKNDEKVSFPTFFLLHGSQEGKTPKGKKRKAKKDEEEGDDSFVLADDEDQEEEEDTPAAKKQKTVFKIPSEWTKLMAADTKNEKLWAQVEAVVEDLTCDFRWKRRTQPTGRN